MQPAVINNSLRSVIFDGSQITSISEKIEKVQLFGFVLE
jgi:hypothetical protein